MAKLTKEMKDMLAVQLPIIATINGDNTPNIGPKRSLRMYDDETLIYNENTGKKHYHNIQKNENVCVIIVDRENLDGYRFVGKAKVYKDGKYFEEAKEWVVGKMGEPKAAVVIKIEKIETLKSGPTAGNLISE